eukprot:GEMP01023026.1.p1 GENE.GEMP01023026.1~~GEMP01023026.1.p1  ORF type:complete len:685 (+),score=140.02 GEMP01023026.1:27-2081(+)
MFSTPLTVALAGALLGLGWRNIQASADIWLLIAALPVGAAFAYTRGPQLQRSLFWIGLSLNGWLTLIALVRSELDPSETGIFVNQFLSMVLLGTSLPHIVRVECTKQEVMSFGLVSGCAVEAALSSHITILKIVLSTALGILGLAGLLREKLSKEEPNPTTEEAITPFMPKTFPHLKQYSPIFMLGRRHAAPLGTPQGQKFVRLVPREEKAPEKKNEVAVRDFPIIQKHLQTVSNAEVGTDIRWDVVLKEMSRVDAEKATSAEQPSAVMDVVDANSDTPEDIESVFVPDLASPDGLNLVVPLEAMTAGIVTPEDLFWQPTAEDATLQPALNSAPPAFNSVAVEPLAQKSAVSPTLHASFSAEKTNNSAINHHAGILLDSLCPAVVRDERVDEPVLDSVALSQLPAVRANGQKNVFNAKAVEFVPKVDDWNAVQLPASPSDLRADAYEFYPESPPADYGMLNASNYSSPDAHNSGISVLAHDDDYGAGAQITEEVELTRDYFKGKYDFSPVAYATSSYDLNATNGRKVAHLQHSNVEKKYSTGGWGDREPDFHRPNHNGYAQQVYPSDALLSHSPSCPAAQHPSDCAYSDAHREYYNALSQRDAYEEFDPRKRVWAYQDPKGRTHRAFSSAAMLRWYEAGFFHDGLQVAYVPRTGSEIRWKPMAEYFLNSTPFSLWPPPHIATGA